MLPPDLPGCDLSDPQEHAADCDAEASAIAACYAPPTVPSRDGAHIDAVWHRLRDEENQ